MNDDAFAELYRQHAPGIRHYCYRRTSCAETARDLCNETFAKALAALRNGVEVRHASGWLYRIAHNLIIDFYRERDKAFVGSFEAMTASVGRQEGDSAALYGTLDLDHWLRDPSDVETETLARIDVEAALPRLTNLQRTVICLRELGGYPFQEIAGEMGLSEGAVKALRHRGIEALRRRMAA